MKLGCNEGWRKGCAQYVVLLGADSDALDFSLGGGGGGGATRSSGRPVPTRSESVGGVGNFSADQASTPIPTTLVFSSPTLPTRARGLLPDGEAGGGTGLGGGGEEGGGLPSPRWVLRPQSVAGGKGSLAQAVRALVDERRKSRAKSRSQLLPGVCCVYVCVLYLRFVAVLQRSYLHVYMCFPMDVTLILATKKFSRWEHQDPIGLRSILVRLTCCVGEQTPGTYAAELQHMVATCSYGAGSTVPTYPPPLFPMDASLNRPTS